MTIFSAFTGSLLPKAVANAVIWVALAILTISLIMIGIRLLRQRLQPVKGIIFLAAGSGISLFILIASYWIMSIDPSLAKSNTHIIKQNLESHEYDLKLKSKISKLYASNVYQNDGEIVNYLTETGEPIQYRPTIEDVELRNSVRRMDGTIKAAQGLARPIFYCWLAITMLSVTAGLFTKISRNAPATEAPKGAGTF